MNIQYMTVFCFVSCFSNFHLALFQSAPHELHRRNSINIVSINIHENRGRKRCFWSVKGLNDEMKHLASWDRNLFWFLSILSRNFFSACGCTSDTVITPKRATSICMYKNWLEDTKNIWSITFRVTILNNYVLYLYYF